MQIKAVAARRMRNEERLKSDGMRGLDFFKNGRDRKRKRKRKNSGIDLQNLKCDNEKLCRVIAEAEDVF